MRKTISDAIIEIAKKHENLNERIEIYGKMMVYYIEGTIVDERMEKYLDPNIGRSEKMKDKKNRLGRTKNKTCQDLNLSGGTTKTISDATTKKPHTKPTKKLMSDESLAIYIDNNIELYDIINKYISNNITYGSIAYQISTHGEKKYIYSQMVEAQKIIKQIGLDNFTTILNYIYQDEFWRKQILSIAKLNRKNKDGVPYYIVIMDKIKQYRPNVISIPTV